MTRVPDLVDVAQPLQLTNDRLIYNYATPEFPWNLCKSSREAINVKMSYPSFTLDVLSKERNWEI